MPGTTRIRLTIGGMHCDGCAGTIRRVATALPGVRSVEVSLAGGCADIEYDPAVTDPGPITAAIADAGYDVAPAAG